MQNLAFTVVSKSAKNRSLVAGVFSELGGGMLRLRIDRRAATFLRLRLAK
jgi:hypothetical protein